MIYTATYTSNLNLKLPEYTDTADVGDLNDNFKKIDDFSGGGKVEEWLSGIQEKADKALSDIQTEATESLAQVQERADEVLASIPEDYAVIDADVKNLKIYKASAIPDASALAASHELYAQKDYPLNVAVHGYTYQEGEGDPSPENVRPISGLSVAQVNVGQGDYITTADLPLLPDNSPLMEGDTVENWVKSGCDKKIVLDGSEDEAWTCTASTGANVRDIFIIADGIPGRNPGWEMDAAYRTSDMYTNRILIDVANQNYLPNLMTGRGSSYTDAFYVYAPFGMFTGDDAASRVAAFRDYLSANPLTVYYRSADYTPEKDLRVCRVVRARKLIDSYAGETITTEYISSTGGLDEGAQVVYKLATPETYMTDPIPLLPPAAIESDTVTVTGSGETEVAYAHETKHYIDSQIAAAVALALNG